jgi:hypothetical protein
MGFRFVTIAGTAAEPAANILESALGIPDITEVSAGLIIIGKLRIAARYDILIPAKL